MKLDYDTLTSEYTQHRQIHPEVLRGLITDSNLNHLSQVLEVGCGTGNYIIEIEKAARCQCWGVEPSEQMLGQAKAQTKRVHLATGSAEKLDLPAEFFDLVFSVDVIHHVSDRLAYFSEAYRVLKPGGKICTVTDSGEIIRQRQPLAVYFPEIIEVELRRYPPIAELRQMMVERGFGNLQGMTVEFSYGTSDIQPYRHKAFSCLHLISSAAFEKGLLKLEQDLLSHPIPCISRYLLLWGTK